MTTNRIPGDASNLGEPTYLFLGRQPADVADDHLLSALVLAARPLRVQLLVAVAWTELVQGDPAPPDVQVLDSDRVEARMPHWRAKDL